MGRFDKCGRETSDNAKLCGRTKGRTQSSRGKHGKTTLGFFDRKSAASGICAALLVLVCALFAVKLNAGSPHLAPSAPLRVAAPAHMATRTHLAATTSTHTAKAAAGTTPDAYFTRDDYTCYRAEGGAVISQYVGDADALELPAEIDGLPVIGIDDNAFYSSFGLKRITLSDTVTELAQNPFSGCNMLEEILVNEGSSRYKSVDGVLFTTDGTELIAYPAGKQQSSYEVPEGVTRIGDQAFALCNSLTSVTLPSTLTSIGNSAFSMCTELTGVTLPEGVTSIGDGAFSRCFSIKSIVLPGSVSELGGNPFSDCIALAEIQVSEDNSRFTGVDGVLYSKDGTQLLVYPGGKQQGSVQVPEGVTSIGKGAFANCDDLTAITLPSSVTHIGARAFYACESLKDITLPSSVASIGDAAFNHCLSLKSVVLPDAVAELGQNPFFGCDMLEEIQVGEGSRQYKSVDGVLFSIDGTELIAYPAGKRQSGYDVPAGMTCIGDQAFAFCGSLTSITLPSSVTRVGEGAFAGCYSLNELSFCGTEEQWEALDVSDLEPGVVIRFG